MSTDWSRTDKLVDNLMKAGLKSLGDDVKRRAVVLAPVDTGALRQSSLVDVNSKDDTVRVSFNTPYARIRHYQNNLNPSTKYYLTNSLKSITNLDKYFVRFN